VTGQATDGGAATGAYHRPARYIVGVFIDVEILDHLRIKVVKRFALTGALAVAHVVHLADWSVRRTTHAGATTGVHDGAAAYLVGVLIDVEILERPVPVTSARTTHRC